MNKLPSNHSSGTSIYSNTGSNPHPPWTATVGKYVLFTKMSQSRFVKRNILTFKENTIK